MPGPILSCGVSNLAQNNEHWRVIVKLGGDADLAEMQIWRRCRCGDADKEELPQQRFAGPKAGTIPTWGERMKVDR
jgi:hypothetical protein